MRRRVEEVWGAIEALKPLVDAEISKVIPENPGDKLYGGMRYHLDAGGKRWRPALAILVCEALGGDRGQVLPYAAAVELLHNFTLIHDDVMDGDRYRRNEETVWVKYGVPHAINIGDGMFNLAYKSVLGIRGLSPSKVEKLVWMLMKAAALIFEGQHMDLDFRYRRDVSIGEYMEMVWRKTGALVGAAIAGAALIGDAKPKTQLALNRYGEKIGPAFQIQDDLIDLTEGKGRRGEIGCDVKEGKRTLMVIHASSCCCEAEGRRLYEILDKSRDETTEEDVGWVVELFKKYGSIKHVEEVKGRLVEEAVNALPTGLRGVLEPFAAFLAERRF